MKLAASIALALIKKFPEARSQTLARIAYRDNKEVFNSPEHARTTIRRLRNAQGQYNRDACRDKGFRTPPMVNSDAFKAIPEGLSEFSEEWGAVQIDGPMRCLMLSDVHIPFQDRTAFIAALKFGKQRRADHILFNGDLLDIHAGSDFNRDPRTKDFPGEIKIAKECLQIIRREFHRARIIFKHGNHEERYERYLSVKAPELLGIPEFEMASLLGLSALEIETIGDKRPIRLGKLNTIHGHEYPFPITNPVNAARGFFLRAKVHMIGGHFHQTSQHSEKNLEQKVVSTWSTGCLCRLHPKWRPLNGWNHGLAFVETDRAGAFQVENLKIIDGKVY